MVKTDMGLKTRRGAKAPSFRDRFGGERLTARALTANRPTLYTRLRAWHLSGHGVSKDVSTLSRALARRKILRRVCRAKRGPAKPLPICMRARPKARPSRQSN